MLDHLLYKMSLRKVWMIIHTDNSKLHTPLYVINTYLYNNYSDLFIQRDTSVSHFINHYQFMTWPKNGAPKSGSGMIDLIDQVTRNQQKTGNKPIIVHCRY